ncbi:MAG: peptidoglycan-binding domain-containing protein, partial [Candidatus Staskawiczbacteria bacterium]|nr:peptidoglycan-binding domain-containing protein [Candidatus Staskawiczbacteria bacterium]
LMCPGTPVQASPTQQQTTSTTLIPSAYKFTRTLKFGMIGQDVKQLQIFLNNNGFLVQKLGLGSKGKETTYFGLGVKNALIRFQQVHSDIILKPVGLTKGTGIFNLRTMNYVNSFYKPSVLKK